jgi:hypothetical protein
MTDLECDPERLYAAAAVLSAVGDRVMGLRRDDVATDPELWGPLGRSVGAFQRYQELADSIGGHLSEAARFCDLAGAALRRTAEAYDGAEQAIVAGIPAMRSATTSGVCLAGTGVP